VKEMEENENVEKDNSVNNDDEVEVIENSDREDESSNVSL
jgi:hypothetical protein